MCSTRIAGHLNPTSACVDQEQTFVITLQLGPLARVHGVFDAQFMQAESVGYVVHLAVVGFGQADPGESALAARLDLTHLGHRDDGRRIAGPPDPVGVDAAVDHRRYQRAAVDRVSSSANGACIANFGVEGNARNDGMVNPPSQRRSD